MRTKSRPKKRSLDDYDDEPDNKRIKKSGKKQKTKTSRHVLKPTRPQKKINNEASQITKKVDKMLTRKASENLRRKSRDEPHVIRSTRSQRVIKKTRRLVEAEAEACNYRDHESDIIETARPPIENKQADQTNTGGESNKTCKTRKDESRTEDAPKAQRVVRKRPHEISAEAVNEIPKLRRSLRRYRKEDKSNSVLASQPQRVTSKGSSQISPEVEKKKGSRKTRGNLCDSSQNVPPVIKVIKPKSAITRAPQVTTKGDKKKTQKTKKSGPQHDDDESHRTKQAQAHRTIGESFQSDTEDEDDESLRTRESLPQYGHRDESHAMRDPQSELERACQLTAEGYINSKMAKNGKTRHTHYGHGESDSTNPAQPQNQITANREQKHATQGNKKSEGAEAAKLVIVTPNPEDVLLGRGKICQQHIGNKMMLKIINKHRGRYHDAEREKKRSMAGEILDKIVMNSKTRFLKLTSDEGEDPLWEEVERVAAIDKISHALRRVKGKKAALTHLPAMEDTEEIMHTPELSSPQPNEEHTSSLGPIRTDSSPLDPSRPPIVDYTSRISSQMNNEPLSSNRGITQEGLNSLEANRFFAPMAQQDSFYQRSALLAGAAAAQARASALNPFLDASNRNLSPSLRFSRTDAISNNCDFLSSWMMRGAGGMTGLRTGAGLGLQQDLLQLYQQNTALNNPSSTRQPRSTDIIDLTRENTDGDSIRRGLSSAGETAISRAGILAAGNIGSLQRDLFSFGGFSGGGNSAVNAAILRQQGIEALLLSQNRGYASPGVAHGIGRVGMLSPSGNIAAMRYSAGAGENNGTALLGLQMDQMFRSRRGY